MRMKAARLHEIGDFQVSCVGIPELKKDEILLKVDACGICGSDIPRIFELGTSKQKYPLTIGHEFCGTVVEVSKEEDRSLIGTSAAVFPLIPCRKCEQCQNGEYAMCRNYDYLGSRSDGGFAEYCVVPSKWHLISASGVPAASLAMTEPAAVALHAVLRAGLKGDEAVVIFGAGPIGIMMSRWCNILGASQVLVVDIVDEKVNFARSRGAKAINGRKADITEAFYKIFGRNAADIAIEGTGTGDALAQCIEIVKPHGTVIMLGNPHKDTTIALCAHSSILRKELNLRGIWNSVYAENPVNEWKYTVNALKSGQLIVEDLITHTCSLDDLPELCRGLYNKTITGCKAMCLLG